MWQPVLYYITCHLADTFIQSNLQLIWLSRRHTPRSNVGLRALLKGPTAVRILSWSTPGIEPPTLWVQVKQLNHYATGCHRSGRACVGQMWQGLCCTGEGGPVLYRWGRACVVQVREGLCCTDEGGPVLYRWGRACVVQVREGLCCTGEGGPVLYRWGRACVVQMWQGLCYRWGRGIAAAV